MPFIKASTLTALAGAVRHGAGIAVPTHQSRRGNPVGFGRCHLPALLQLTGDQGARQLVRNSPVQEVPVDDPGILLDLDFREDLARLSVSSPGLERFDL
jgi:molybdenum cofactor cytidylyltransferase